MMTREAIRAVYDQGPEAVLNLGAGLCAVIAQQQAQIVALTARVKELEDRLATNSRNSSKPPASDAPAQRTRSLREPSTRPTGGQKGHRGTTLKFSAAPDRVIKHPPAQCCRCGASLEEVSGTPKDERRQVFDLPPLQLEVTEHRVRAKDWPRCGELNLGSFPAEVPVGASYGAGVKGFLAYVNNWHLLPAGRSCELFAALFHHPIAEGTLQAANETWAAALADTTACIKAALCRAGVGHFDETGLYVAGERHWLHVASTEQLTAYEHHHKRGSVATAEIGILPHFSGVAVHDGLRSYLTYACLHALCNAHHLRELTFLHEQMQQDWAQQMKDLLVASKHAVEAAQAAGETRLGAASLNALERHYDAILQAGFAVAQRAAPLPAEGKRGRKKQSKAKNLLDRLARYKEETLRFLKDFRVPFDNNLAERDLRMMKVQQKVSGCFRTSAGATNFCRIRGDLSTMRKQAHNPLSVLKSVFLGTPLAPNLPG